MRYVSKKDIKLKNEDVCNLTKIKCYKRSLCKYCNIYLEYKKYNKLYKNKKS